MIDRFEFQERGQITKAIADIVYAQADLWMTRQEMEVLTPDEERSYNKRNQELIDVRVALELELKSWPEVQHRTPKTRAYYKRLKGKGNK